MSSYPTSFLGASVVIYYIDSNNNIYILTGIESRWLRNSYPELKKQEIFNVNMGINKAKEYFTETARNLSKKLDKEVRYDQIVQKYENKYETRYRSLSHNKDKIKYGIIKGGVEPGETSKMTIIREIAEELGIIVPKEKLIKIGFDRSDSRRYVIFHLMIEEEVVPFFKKIIRERKKKYCGEVFELSFKRLNDVMQDLNKYNKRSFIAIKKFAENI